MFLRSIMAGLVLSLGVIGPSESEAARLKLVVGGPEFVHFKLPFRRRSLRRCERW